ncbi:MAG TPA: palindromic element RPE5 domain-containing protein [Rickettsia endosymbiont of Pyrocoelia pectoralis]|nr:palindromic element RPE5 domain-containing protein [Rickettsia endosymbiont of Pyrocoelia pectoralis]
MEKSKEFVNQGAEHNIVREHPKVYKDIVTNFSNSASILIVYL